MASKTWILTGSPENFAATREHGFRVIGMKEGRRNMAQQMEPGDLIVFYLTRVKAFGGAVRITGEMYEDRSKLWPGKPGKPDPYPWRFETEPEVVLDEDDWVPAEELAPELEHARKWPAEHWTLAFQGQLRTVSDADRDLILDRLAVTAERVRTLLLRGDNLLKSARPERFGRAMEAFEEAREAAATTTSRPRSATWSSGASTRCDS